MNEQQPIPLTPRTWLKAIGARGGRAGTAAQREARAQNAKAAREARLKKLRDANVNLSNHDQSKRAHLSNQ